MNMKIKQIVEKLEKLAPQKLAYSWDNVGLLFGSGDWEVKKILLTLDMDENVASEAARKGANLVIGHHPIFFNPAQKITDNFSDGKAVMTLAENKTAYFAAHTNLDIAKGGLNDLFAKKLELYDAEILEYTEETQGIGRIGKCKPMSLSELAKKVKDVFGTQYVRVCGNEEKIVKTVAVNSGGGTALIGAAIKEGADVLVTGDFKYAQMRECVFGGLNVIDIGHYNTEILCRDIFYEFLKNEFKDEIEIEFSQENTNVMKFI